ncbi:complex I subunit 5 family protein [Kaarinaea lacus]
MSESILQLSLLLSFVLPLLLASAVCIHTVQPWLTRLSVVAPLPALFTAVAVIATDAPDISINLTWVLNGSQLILDTTGQLFLLFTAFVWLSAAIFCIADTRNIQQRNRFYFCFLLSMAGNIGVILAGELALFYTFFALMSFSAYGVIVSNDDGDAVRAGRVYITLVIIGEVLLFSAFVIGALFSGSSLITQWQTAAPAAVTVPLIILGFGVKVGAIPWHFVLPVTYRVTPTAAAVALGGAMLNAGLLGWIRFLPLGQVSVPDWGTSLVILGLLASFIGALFGMMQNNPKALLGYSSVSQVGLMTVIVGLVLIDHHLWEMFSAILLLYALHHGLAKGALFYAVGTTQAYGQLRYYWQCFALLLPALSIAGAPLTTGALVKTNFKEAIVAAPDFWINWLTYLLPLSSIATSLLLIRFVLLVWPKRTTLSNGTGINAQLVGQAILVVAVACCTWLVADAKGLGNLSLHLKGGNLWASTWPILLAVATAAGVAWVLKQSKRQLPLFPTGDILLPVETVTRFTVRQLSALGMLLGRIYTQVLTRFPAIVIPDAVQNTERLLRTPIYAGILFTLIFIAILLALSTQ